MKKVSWYDKIKSGANYTDYVKIYVDNVLKQEFKTSAVTCPDDRSVIIIQQENNLHKGFQKVALSFPSTVADGAQRVPLLWFKGPKWLDPLPDE